MSKTPKPSIVQAEPPSLAHSDAIVDAPVSSGDVATANNVVLETGSSDAAPRFRTFVGELPTAPKVRSGPLMSERTRAEIEAGKKALAKYQPAE
jgi:hypothetical protein